MHIQQRPGELAKETTWVPIQQCSGQGARKTKLVPIQQTLRQPGWLSTPQAAAKPPKKQDRSRQSKHQAHSGVIQDFHRYSKP